MPSTSSRRSSRPRLPRVLAELVPPTPMSRRLALQSLLSRTGQGAFDTVSAVFLLKVVGISPGSVGLAITIALVARSIGAYPAGRLVDLAGPKRVWWLAEALLAVAFVTMPWVDSFLTYVVFAVVFEVVGAAGESANRAYTLDVLPPAERVQTQAHIYSAINLGFTIGALLGGIALAFGSTEVVRWLPWGTATVLAINSAAIARLPDASHDLRVADRAAPREPVAGP
ncbi:MAG: MFS transporter, partial [Nocardioides sp.]|uniref:MFS transporter n=1 Tax=Nocardioides sp. TaxID=35761 RepID=UPI0039E6F83F